MGVELVGAFEGEKDVVGSVVWSGVGSFWELGAEKVGVLNDGFLNKRSVALGLTRLPSSSTSLLAM